MDKNELVSWCRCGLLAYVYNGVSLTTSALEAGNGSYILQLSGLDLHGPTVAIRDTSNKYESGSSYFTCVCILRSVFVSCVLCSVSLTCVFKNQYFFNKIYIFTNICVFYFI